jgi:transcription initiation factor TFIIIB Brf1 subunit/transcription initiation factor TFIIB
MQNLSQQLNKPTAIAILAIIIMSIKNGNNKTKQIVNSFQFL